ncbi:hypothetical protein N3K66_001189 [Trichothecium roseum]|uniref:Uncharacterized protein n=1 Tax=Trichothecium roseum TaxID=47278 RepID=A0ACC0VE11_9HYPO|nr:hypothetical protein N3K66_001189 [Trichothecium roseum]
MAIRDRFRRALHKSASTESITPSQSNTTITTTQTSGTVSSSETTSSMRSLRKAQSTMFGCTFTWGRGEKDLEKEKKKEEEKERERERKRKRSKKPIHPRDRPLTEQNLRHQEALSHFTMTFGSESMASASNRLSYIGGVSPCCTRPASMIDGIDSVAMSPRTSQDIDPLSS